MTRRDFLLSSAAGLAVARRLRAQSVDLHHVICPGHSLMFGTSGGASLSTSQPFANKILSGGTALSNLVAINSVEDPPCGMANQLRSLAGSGYDVVVTRDGHPSTKYVDIAKGTTFYSDSVANAQLLPAAAAAAGKTYKYSAIMCILGENDPATVNGATYALDMRQLQADYSADINGGVKLPMFIHQFDGWNQGTHQMATPLTDFDGTPNPAQGQWWAMRDNPASIFLVCPLYPFWGGYADGIHLLNSNYRKMGELFGKWMKYVLVDGAPFSGLPPRAFSISGATVTAQFWLRPGRSLVIDTTIVPSQGAGRGFEVYDATAGSNLTISSVSVSGDTATITLSGAPTAGHSLRLRYAYTATLGAGGGTAGCGAGNLRNDDPTVGQGSGATLYDWAFMFDEAIPFWWTPGADSPVKGGGFRR
jgi:hypothetical protein